MVFIATTHEYEAELDKIEFGNAVFPSTRFERRN